MNIFYVSVTGSDSGNGSKEYPFATIEKAYKEVCASDGDVTVVLTSGIHPIKETLLFTPDICKDRHITFKGETATLFGGVNVTGWEKHTDKIYKAHLDVLEARNLYVNTFPAHRARSKYIYTMKEIYVKDGAEAGMKVSSKNFPKSFYNWRDMEIVNPYEWECHRYRITDYSYDEGAHEHIFEFDTSYNTMKRLGKDTYCFYLENDMSLLDEPGEFYYDRAEKTIYYYPYDQEDMSTAVTYVGQKEMFVHILGTNENRAGNVTFEGICFSAGACNALTPRGYRCYQSDALDKNVPELSGETPENGYFSINTSQFRMNFAQNIVVRNCEFINMGSAVIAMHDSVSNVLIEGNIFRDSSAGALRIGNPYHRMPQDGIEVCSDVTVKNNVITRMGGEIFNNCAISVYYEKNVRILNNVITDMPYTGVSLSWGWEGAVGYDCHDLEVGYNRIARVMGVLHDGGAVYTLGEIKKGSIHHNFFEDSQDRGLYNDAGSACINSYNNVIVGCKLFIQVQELRYLTHHINVYNNFSDDPKTLGPTHEGTIEVKRPFSVDRNNLSQEARAIVEEAGLEPCYRGLEAKAEMPSWHRKRTQERMNKFFKSKNGDVISKLKGIIEAEDYMEGGEGVGYHKTFKPEKGNNGYRPNDEVQLLFSSQTMSHAIHMDEAGEWLCYKWTCPETDDYFIEMTVRFANGENIAKWYIDDKELDIRLSCDDSNVFSSVTSEAVHVEKGDHILKMEFVVPFYFDKFRLYTGKETPIPEELYYTSDEDYNE